MTKPPPSTCSCSTRSRTPPRRQRRSPTSASPDVRVRAPGDRRRRARAADAAGGAGLRRGGHRLGVPRRAGGDGAAARARQSRRSARPAFPFEVPRARRLGRTARRRAGRDLRRLRRRLDAIPPAPTRRGATSPGSDLAGRAVVVELLPERSRSARPARADAACAGAALHARRDAHGRLRAAGRAGRGAWDRRTDRGSRGAAAARERARRRPGRYQLEAAVQSAHVVRRLRRPPDHAAILQLYEALCALDASPVAALNRAVASAEVHGPQAALAAIEALADEPRLQDYQPYWAARAHLLALCGRRDEAAHATSARSAWRRDDAVRRFLLRRGSELYPPPGRRTDHADSRCIIAGISAGSFARADSPTTPCRCASAPPARAMQRHAPGQRLLQRRAARRQPRDHAGQHVARARSGQPGAAASCATRWPSGVAIAVVAPLSATTAFQRARLPRARVDAALPARRPCRAR